MLKGIDKNWGIDILWGVLFAVGILLITSFGFIGTIGIPSVPQSVAGDIGRFLIIVFVASIFESFLFYEFILDFFDEKAINLPYVVASILVSGIFAFFHFYAYGSSLISSGGSFLSAFIISFSWCYLRKWTNSILPIIISHSIINFWIIRSLVIVI